MRLTKNSLCTKLIKVVYIRPCSKTKEISEKPITFDSFPARDYRIEKRDRLQKFTLK